MPQYLERAPLPGLKPGLGVRTTATHLRNPYGVNAS